MDQPMPHEVPTPPDTAQSLAELALFACVPRPIPDDETREALIAHNANQCPEGCPLPPVNVTITATHAWIPWSELAQFAATLPAETLCNLDPTVPVHRWLMLADPRAKHVASLTALAREPHELAAAGIRCYAHNLADPIKAYRSLRAVQQVPWRVTIGALVERQLMARAGEVVFDQRLWRAIISDRRERRGEVPIAELAHGIMLGLPQCSYATRLAILPSVFDDLVIDSVMHELIVMVIVGISFLDPRDAVTVCLVEHLASMWADGPQRDELAPFLGEAYD